MQFEEYFPLWDKLTPQQKDTVRRTLIRSTVKKGDVIHNGSLSCAGLLVLKTGQFRAYMLSEEGREITLYRLFERDICLFSASCVMPSVQFEIIIQAQKDSDIWVIPPGVFKKLMEESAAVANYTNALMADRFSQIMWLVEQILWKRQDARLADYLLEESIIEDTNSLRLTHEAIANHLGTHREVVTRMLRYLQGEGMVLLTRGGVELTDRAALRRLADAKK